MSYYWISTTNRLYTPLREMAKSASMTFPTDKSTHSFVQATIYYVAGIVQALGREVQKNGHLPKVKGHLLTLKINYKGGRKFPLFTTL